MAMLRKGECNIEKGECDGGEGAEGVPEQHLCPRAPKTLAPLLWEMGKIKSRFDSITI
jgi:hypothetical protein